jgi:hypothetical protein
MNWKNWTGGATFWKTLPNSSLFIFLAGVFCLFGSLGFTLDTLNLQKTTVSELTINVVVRSCFGVCWAFLGVRRMFKSMIPLAAVQITALWLLVRVYRNMPSLAMDAATIKDKLTVDAAGILISFTGGYVLFLLFFQREGKRFFAAHTEISLAAEIHHSLVPKLSFKTREFEFFGASFPSGAVGGDLVDVVAGNNGWFAYVADVSGHGVPAGVLMSMTKSAVRMWLASRVAHDSALLSDVNSVVKPLLTPNMFITFAYAAWDGGPDLAFSSAGHVPLLHYRESAAKIEQCAVGFYCGREDRLRCIGKRMHRYGTSLGTSREELQSSSPSRFPERSSVTPIRRNPPCNSFSTCRNMELVLRWCLGLEFRRLR